VCRSPALRPRARPPLLRDLSLTSPPRYFPRLRFPQDEECKVEMVSALEDALPSEAPAAEPAAAAPAVAAVVAAAPAAAAVVAAPAEAPKAAESKKDAKAKAKEEAKVSEPPLNFDRLKSVGTFVRTVEIWSFVFAFVIRRVGLELKFTYKGGFTEAKKLERTERLANWLRLGLLRLGPTFIKIGQQFSTRVDVLSKPFITELEKLQDRVPPFPTSLAKQIVEEELGRPLGDVYEEFADDALAAASLGQVHLAKLKMTGEQVIVKVQRPGLKEIFDIDLKNLRVIAQWLQKVDPKTDGAARDWVAIFDETARVLYDEVDYQNEASNAQEFAAQFADTEWIKVPKIYQQYTKTRTLCMEYAPATKINDVEAIRKMGIEPDRMARLAVEAYLQQVLRYGFFHADPHPGNVAVDKGDPEGKGRLVIYDYGMMGRIPDEVRGGFLELFYAVFEKNSDNAVKALSKMGVLVETGGDLTAVKRTADFFLGSFDERVDKQEKERETNKDEYEAEFKKQRTKEEKKARRKQILSNIGEDLLVVSKDQPFRFPAELTFVVRAFSVLDGIGKSLNKKFDIGEISAPYARELLIEDNPSSLPPQVVARQRDFQRRFDRQNKAIVNLFKGPDAIEEIAEVVRAIERGKLKIRVRALEAERAIERVAVMQDVMLKAMVACAAINVGVVMYVSGMLIQAKVAFGVSAAIGLQAIMAQGKLSKLVKKEASYSGAA
jgi:predicted unusual protein kinase regulating ubiquinone biosynthesis (AarF/ABC1/UbiB family)